MTRYIIAAAIAVAILVGFGIHTDVTIWNECRAFGHGVLYCTSMLSNR